MNPARFALTVLLLAAPALQSGAAPDAAPPAKPSLKEGDPAPAVRLGECLKGEPIQALDPEGTYIIEFWAVECSCCVAEIPHMTALARELGGKATFISVGVWNEDAAKVRAFVKKQGVKMGGHIVRDKNGFMQENWLDAAGQDGIPCAFVVVKGRILCIDHPVNLDAKLIAGLQDGTITPRELSESREQGKACGKEFRAMMRFPITTKAALRDAIEKLRKLAAKYPKAKYPGIMIRHCEKKLSGN